MHEFLLKRHTPGGRGALQHYNSKFFYYLNVFGLDQSDILLKNVNIKGAMSRKMI